MNSPLASATQKTNARSTPHMPSIDDHHNYPGLDFSREELAAVMRQYYDDLIDFVAMPEFRLFYDELMSLHPNERPAFLASVLFEPEALAKRGIVVPNGVLIQTSAFGDRRPTLFAVKKLLPEKYAVAWENVNLTFDNEYEDESVPRSAEASWRPPLPVSLQNELLATGQDLQSVPVERGVAFGIYKSLKE